MLFLRYSIHRIDECASGNSEKTMSEDEQERRKEAEEGGSEDL